MGTQKMPYKGEGTWVVLYIRVPFGGVLYIRVPYYNGDLKRDPNLENYPHGFQEV